MEKFVIFDGLIMSDLETGVNNWLQGMGDKIDTIQRFVTQSDTRTTVAIFYKVKNETT